MKEKSDEILKNISEKIVVTALVTGIVTAQVGDKSLPPDHTAEYPPPNEPVLRCSLYGSSASGYDARGII
jgi:hypothetical protein